MVNPSLNYMKIKILLILIVASFLRLYHLGSVPIHLTPDEAAIGYNAYSLLKTGHDEHGQILPIIFKSFGDYKPGLYVYGVIPSIAVLGLNEFSVRFPSAIFGIISAYLVYLLIKKLFNEKLAFAASFILAINPWHIYFSRGAWEINLALFLTLLGTYFFFKALEKSKYLLLSALFFALTLLSYQGAKLSTGIVVLILGVLYHKEILKFKIKNVIAAAIIGIIICVPIILSILTGKAGRLTVFSVFSYPRPAGYIQNFLDEGGEKIGDLNYYLFHSESLNFLRGILGRYFNHFSGRFLFFEGDWQNLRHSPPNQGMFLLVDILLLLSGVIYFFREKISREKIFVLLWLLLAPLPAALSRDQVHAVRSFNLVIPLAVIMAFGLTRLVKSKKLLAVYVLVFIASFIYFLDAYFVHLPVHNAKYWQYGYKQVAETVLPIQKNYMNIYVQQNYAQPYIYFLFFGKDLDQKLYFKDNNLDVGLVEKLNNITFAEIDLNSQQKGNLLIVEGWKVDKKQIMENKNIKIIREIDYPNNKEVAFWILESL